MKKPVYLDYHATTPCDPRVLEAMLPLFCEEFGNPSSRGHAIGRASEERVEAARQEVAQAIGARAGEVVFTSGATEANNLALLGAARFRREAGHGDHVISAATEHKSVLEPLHALEEEGFRVTFLPVDRHGVVDPDAVAAALADGGAVLVSVMLANNEIGTIQPLAEISRVAHEGGAWMHTDAVQGVGKIAVDVEALDVDLLSLSGHKFYGPKGVGALYVRQKPRRIKLAPILTGGGQERGIRSGTHNVPGIVGLGAACRLCCADREAEAVRLAGLRDRLEASLRERIEGLLVNGHPVDRLPHNLSVSIPQVDGEALLLSLDDICVSSGSACRSSAPGASHVMKAIGHDDELGKSTIRFGLGRWTTPEEISFAVGRVSDVVERLRAMSAFA
jgi:cysteine desulfurase